jgi:hypothetical protein
MLNALSFTRGGLTYFCVKVSKVGQTVMYDVTHARGLCQATQGPFADILRCLDRRRVRLLDKRLADDIYDKLFRRTDVSRRVFALSCGVQDRKRDNRRVEGNLVVR